MRRHVVAIAALPLAFALASCGSSAPSSDTESPDSVASAGAAGSTDSIPADAAFNKGDVVFAQNMIPHHQQAVEMSTIALDPARKAGPEVKDLATRIQGAQDSEIKLMTGWLEAWGQPADSMAGKEDMEGHDMADMAGMEGMMTADEMKSLGASSAADFDKMWLTMMIRHHEGAIAMGKTEQTEGKNPEAKALAGKIVTAQEGEIAEMKQLLA